MTKTRSTSKNKKNKKPLRIRDEFIYDTIMDLCLERPEASIRPEEIAMKITTDDWQAFTKRIRIFAKKLALDGYINIIRKGNIADPDDFRGVYRVRAAEKASSYEPRMPEEE